MMQKPKILAADNTKVALRYMETILGDIYDVTLVQTGMSVLDCLKSEIPDLILMNANMFGMDGYEVLRRIKEDKETKEIPVILMMLRPPLLCGKPRNDPVQSPPCPDIPPFGSFPCIADSAAQTHNYP